MLVRIETNDSRPIYRQIMDEIRRAVVLGLAAPGEILPSVRQLAADLRVNPNTVQQAYRELERQGVVTTRRGLGTFVSERLRMLEGERRRLASQVARRSLADGYRHGLRAEELIAAIRRLAAEGPPDPPIRAMEER